MREIADRGRKILSRILRAISVSAASLILQACPAYGMPPPEYGMPSIQTSIRGEVTSTKTGVPIFGIKVSIEGTEYYERTDKYGHFYIYGLPIQETYNLKFEDVDGPYNDGLFKEQTWTLRKDDVLRYLLIGMDLDTETNGE